MSKNYNFFILSYILFVGIIFFLNIGCSTDKFKLGLDEKEVYVDKIVTFINGKQTNYLANIKTAEHIILECRAYNQKNEIVKNSPITMITTDDKIIKILTVYSSKDYYYAILRGEGVGTAEVILSSGNVSVPVYLSVSTQAVTDKRAYIKFIDITTEPILVNSAKQYKANYVDENGTVVTNRALIWMLIPNDEKVAKITNQTLDSVTILGIATGSVELLVRDAENKAAASVNIKVN